jgi:hypothetical protein
MVDSFEIWYAEVWDRALQAMDIGYIRLGGNGQLLGDIPVL